jgi:hypothetical protein
MRPTSSSGRAVGQRAGAVAKATVKLPVALRRRRTGGDTRKGARGLREQVRLFGKGKLCRAVPGTRAAWNKAAKCRGPRRTAGSARDPCVPRARKPEPSRGARTLRTAPARVWRSSPVDATFGSNRRQQGAPDVVRSWEQEPQERRPTTRERHDSASAGSGRRRGVGGG